MRKVVQRTLKRHRDAIIDRWVANAERGSAPLGMPQPFGPAYLEAVLGWINHGDADVFRPALVQLSSSGADRHALNRVHGLMSLFKQATLEVALERNQWQVPELNQLHALLDGAIAVSLEQYANVGEAQSRGGSEADQQHWLAEIARERGKLEAVLSGLGACALLIDRDYRIIWANEGTRRQHGAQPALEGEHCFRRLWGFSAACDDCCARHFALSGVETAVHARTGHDNSKRYVQTIAVPVRDNGKVEQVLEVMLDVTQAKQTEEQLQAREELLGAVVRDCADAIITLDTEGRIRSWNAGAEGLFGYTADEIVGRPFTILIPQHLNERDEAGMLQRRTMQDGSVRDFETERVRKDGKRLRVSITRSLLHDSRGNCIGTSAVIRDITERKTWELQLAHADRLVTMGTMAAGLAHEIGNPLGAISSVVQVLQRRIHDANLAKRLDLVREQVSRITTIVREMADFSRPKGQSEPRVQISDVVQHAVTLARYSHTAPRVAVEIDIDPNMPPLPIEAERLLQVFLNLVLNAYDAVAGEGSLRIEGRYGATEVAVRFADSGPGVAAPLRERIFEPFFTTKAKGYGTGMGLFVSHRIVQDYGGSITVAEAPQGGALFTVKLPLRTLD